MIYFIILSVIQLNVNLQSVAQLIVTIQPTICMDVMLIVVLLSVIL